MKTCNNRRVAAAARRLPSAVGYLICICSGTSSVSAFQSTTSTLSSFGSPSYNTRKLAATHEQSRNNKFQLLVTSYSHEEDQQQYQINDEETYLEHQYYGWDADDDTSSWFPMTDSLLEEIINSRQMLLQEEENTINGEGAPTATEEKPTSTEILLDSLKPKPIDTVTTEDIEEQFLRMVSNEVEYKQLLGQSPYALTDIKFPVLLQRFLDNIEDSSQKNNGKVKGQSKLRGRDQPRDERKTVVVLGTGWASHAFIKLASTYDLRIVVVSPVNHFVFT